MRSTRQLAGAVLVTLGVAGCGASSHDNPAFTGAPAGAAGTAAPTTVPAGGPGITEVRVGSVATPHLAGGAGATAIDAALSAMAVRLGAGGRACSVTTTLADRALVSWRWLCSDRSVATATFSLATGRQLALADLLHGAYLPYLSTTAVAQLEAGGVTPAAATALAAPTMAAFSRWGLTATALDVTFPAPTGPVTIAYPLGTLGSFLPPAGLPQ